MSSKTICKTVHQYNKKPISKEDMEKLQEIAGDYRKVKNYVYSRYGGIGSLLKLYPGYTIQNEMTESGLRLELGLPSVYFYLAVFDALGDIKSQWTYTKTKVLKLMNKNENFTPEEKHYIRFLLKTGNAFAAVLNRKKMELPKEIQRKHEELASQVEAERLQRYLRRQVRKHHVKQHTDTASGFSITERAYRYADHGIYISTKEKRNRIFILLTDKNQYTSQLYIKLYPEKSDMEIKVPVKVSVHTHADYTNQVGVAAGMFTMLTTDKGHRYGKSLGELQTRYAEWIREQTICYNRNKEANSGRKKYNFRKNRFTEQLHSYVNYELNRFFREERPRVVYIVKLPRSRAGGINKKINNNMALWKRGYIRKRLAQKCQEESVELIEVLGRDISGICSRCGSSGYKKEGIFTCGSCGFCIEEKTNTAANTLRRGIEGKIVY